MPGLFPGGQFSYTAPVEQVIPSAPVTPSPPRTGGYPTGPSTTRSPYHANPAPAAAPSDPWANVPPAIHTQADQLVNTFLNSVGWPKGYDANQAALHLAQAGTNIMASPFNAYEWLYQNTVSGDTKNLQPWAEFGMDADTYHQTVSKLNASYFTWTGQQLGADVVKQAILGSWTPDQLQNFAMFGNASGSGTMLPSAQLSGSMPWLSTGQSYTQTLENFQQFEGHTPTDGATLAAWFRFGQGAKQLGSTSGPTATTPARPVVATGSEVR